MDKITPQGWTLTPAYGRDYRSRKALIESLNKPEDWVGNHYSGQSGFMSIRDMADGDYTVRFKRLANVAIIKVRAGIAS